MVSRGWNKDGILHGTKISGAGSLLRGVRFETMSGRNNQDPRSRGRRRGNLMPTVQADRLTRIGAALLNSGWRFRRRGQCRRGRLRQRQSGGSRFPRHYRDPDLYRPHQGRPYRSRREMDHRAGIADHHRDRRPLGFWLSRQRQGDGADHRKGEDRQCRGLHGVPAKSRRPPRRLSDDGDARRHDRACDGGFRPFAQTRRAVRWPRGAARHQPDFDRGAVGPRGAVLSGHGDIGRCRGKDSTGGLARRGNPDRLDRRQRGTADHRPETIPQRRRATAAGRHRRLQGQRPRCDGRGAVRPPDRSRLWRRADRASQ